MNHHQTLTILNPNIISSVVHFHCFFRCQSKINAFLKFTRHFIKREKPFNDKVNDFVSDIAPQILSKSDFLKNYDDAG